MEVEDMSKSLWLSVIFYILRKGCVMIDYPSLSALLHILKVHFYPRSRWLVNIGWEWESCLGEVDKENFKAKIKEPNFIEL